MDLKDFDVSKKSEEGADLILLHPSTFEPLDVSIRLVGRDSAKYRNKVRELSERAMNANKGKRGQKLDIDKAEREGAEILAACTLGWSGITEDGKEIAFSEKEAQRIYTEHRWIREQVDGFIADRANFFPA